MHSTGLGEKLTREKSKIRAESRDDAPTQTRLRRRHILATHWPWNELRNMPPGKKVNKIRRRRPYARAIETKKDEHTRITIYYFPSAFRSRSLRKT